MELAVVSDPVDISTYQEYMKEDSPATMKFAVFLLTSVCVSANSPVSGSLYSLKKLKTFFNEGSFSLTALLLAITDNEYFLRSVTLRAK